MSVHAYLTQLTAISADAAEDNVASVRKLFKPETSSRSPWGSGCGGHVEGHSQVASWSSFQSSLDKFLQRISVAEPAKE